MSVSPVYDENGFLLVEPESDRCAHYVPRDNLLNMNRCVCCVSFDAFTRRCRSDETRIDPLQGKETHNGE